jgi:hypothetical protein
MKRSRFSEEQIIGILKELEAGISVSDLGLLTALYSGQLIEFADKEPPRDAVPSKSGHPVICEAHEPLSEVIAANYAYGLNAGLHIFDETDEVEGKALLEAFYSIDVPAVNAAAERARLSARMRKPVGAVDLPPNGSLTFIVRQLLCGNFRLLCGNFRSASPFPNRRERT